MADQWGLLSEQDENELHKQRLLNVEEKPYKRVTKRLRTLYSEITAQHWITHRAEQAQTASAESNGAIQTDQPNDALSPAPGEGLIESVNLGQLREDITLDFAALDNSISRLQFTLNAQARERERFASVREDILATSQQVRENNAQLRLQLDQARETLEQRRKFDELADQITNNPALRPRNEQEANIRKLQEEIAELEAEKETYGVTWQERRDQFARIMDESMRLGRLIRDEKEEVERREGMDDGEAEPGQTPRPGTPNGNSTPRLDSGLLVKSGAESADVVGTPQALSTAGGRTPARESPAPSMQDNQSFLKPSQAGESFSQAGSQAGSREGSVDGKTEQDTHEGEGDVEMAEIKDDNSEPDSPLSPPPADLPQILVGNQDDTMDTT
ncbi:Tho complex subunit 7-domain-containing protein [Cladorrhinum samala]|uniref:Tho complex subunit 7-domain-containing protein n=1 Tax=Cladorrhinum samala TaxID=585594 RepID=A0AAV9HVJ4_9PEZI|nr:Tho complex subunit 7-domain-containing protein [Cladorrhinum samala]